MSRFIQDSKESQNTTNAIGHLGMVENLARDADRQLQEYHKLVELYRQDLEFMRNKINNINDEINDTTLPLVEGLHQNLEVGIASQKEENTNFQDQLTEIKKEKSILSQMIVAVHKRADQLKQEVGHY